MNADEMKTHEAAVVSRMDREDDLFAQRLNIFLLVNGLAGAAISIQGTSPEGRAGIAFVAVVLNAMWLLCSVHTITTKSKFAASLPQVNDSFAAVREALGNHERFRPNVILGIYIPVALSVAWLCASVANLCHWAKN